MDRAAVGAAMDVLDMTFRSGMSANKIRMRAFALAEI